MRRGCSERRIFAPILPPSFFSLASTPCCAAAPPLFLCAHFFPFSRLCFGRIARPQYPLADLWVSTTPAQSAPAPAPRHCPRRGAGTGGAVLAHCWFRSAAGRGLDASARHHFPTRCVRRVTLPLRKAAPSPGLGQSAAAAVARREHAYRTPRPPHVGVARAAPLVRGGQPSPRLAEPIQNAMGSGASTEQGQAAPAIIDGEAAILERAGGVLLVVGAL